MAKVNFDITDEEYLFMERECEEVKCSLDQLLQKMISNWKDKKETLKNEEISVKNETKKKREKY